MKTNKASNKEQLYTYEGGKASKINVLEQLERSVMSCLLWEDQFYENGVSIAETIETLVKECIKSNKYDEVVKLIKKVRLDMKIRHCPLWMIVAVYRAGKTLPKELIASVLTRADDAGELISLYRKYDKKAPIPNAFKKGIAIAFQQFDEYQLGKWNKDAVYRLVDIVNLCHIKPTEAINKLMKGTLPTPMTWEVELSKAGSSEIYKRDAWEMLLAEKKLGGMAFLKNIAGMLRVNVKNENILNYLKEIKASKLLPIDFIRAGKKNPQFENEIENKFFESFVNMDKEDTPTAILVDVSGSMYYEEERIDYANALAMIAREMYSDVNVYTFSNEIKLIPNRRGFALRDAINNSQGHNGTHLGTAINYLHSLKKYEKIIVITDEQTSDGIENAKTDKEYIINVASYQRGIGYNQGYKHINGFSDKVFDYIREMEK